MTGDTATGKFFAIVDDNGNVSIDEQEHFAWEMAENTGGYTALQSYVISITLPRPAKVATELSAFIPADAEPGPDGAIAMTVVPSSSKKTGEA